MKRKIFVLILLIIVSVGFISGYSFGRSNLYGMYPAFSKMTPMKPFNRDSFMVNNYKNDVTNYVKEAKEYVEAANNDISTINDEIDNAITKANRVVDEYNNWARYGY